VNGRFLTQIRTGVQRYGFEILSAMDRQLMARGGDAPRGDILLPRRGQATDVFATLRRREIGPLRGHAWEQITLGWHARGPLLSFCNTGPLLRRRQIVCLHGATSFVHPSSYGRMFRATQRVILPTLGRRAARVTTVSHASARLLHDLGIVPRDRAITVVPNGHEHARHWRPERSRVRHAAPFERPFVLLIGSRAPHKNIRLVVSIAPALAERGLDVLIAGHAGHVFGTETLTPHPNIRLLGFVSDDDLAFLLSRAVCLAFPSLSEGFGLPLVEAMAWHCPVIASNVASMPEVCGDAALLVAPDRPADWLAAIDALRHQPDLRRTLIARGAARIRLFSWETSAAAYLDLLRHAADTDAVRPAATIRR
jgi:glycosyltransferase involved in cell wall biosynthesis